MLHEIYQGPQDKQIEQLMVNLFAQDVTEEDIPDKLAPGEIWLVMLAIPLATSAVSAEGEIILGLKI